MLSSALNVASSRSASSIAARIASLWAAAVLRPEQRQFEPCPQPRERRLQIVGDVVGDLAHRGHQSLDLVEHPVQIGGELVELVIGAGPRHPIRQVAGHDAFGGPVHLLDAAQHVAAHHRAAHHADRERDETRPKSVVLMRSR